MINQFTDGIPRKISSEFGIKLSCSSYYQSQGNVSISLSVIGRGVNETITTHDYQSFSSAWLSVTDRLAVINGLSEKPTEWSIPPCKKYYSDLIRSFETRCSVNKPHTKPEVSNQDLGQYFVLPWKLST